MTKIGRPPEGRENPYANAKMGNVARLNNAKKRSLQDQLNQVAGIRTQNDFVDAKEHNKMDKDAFMKLLAFQLENQDPLNPVDQKKFTAELAQFAQLEQMTKMNSNIEGMTSSQPTEAKFHGASFLGREVLTAGTSIKYDGDSSQVQIPYYLPKDAAKVFIRVFDDKNQLIAQFEKEGVSRGAQNAFWDGLSRDGTVAAKGNYRFQVIGFDQYAEEFAGQTRAKGVVTGVSFENGETVFTVDDGRRVFLRDVVSINLPESKSQKKSLDDALKESEGGATAIKQGLKNQLDQAQKAYQNIEGNEHL